MYKGTTPEINIKVGNDVDFDKAKIVWVTFTDGKVEVTLEKDECTFDNVAKTIAVKLTHRVAQYRVSNTNSHPSVLGHERLSTGIEAFLRTL